MFQLPNDSAGGGVSASDGEDLPVALSRLRHLPHPQDDLRLLVAAPPRSRWRPRERAVTHAAHAACSAASAASGVPPCAVNQSLRGDDRRLGVVRVRREDRHPGDPRRGARGEDAEARLKALGGARHRGAARARVVAEVSAGGEHGVRVGARARGAARVVTRSVVRLPKAIVTPTPVLHS